VGARRHLHHVLTVLANAKLAVKVRSRAGTSARLLFALMGATGCATGTGSSPEADEVAPEPVVAVYTEEQAARGERTFTSVCSVCHGRNEFVGPIFALTWMAEPVGHLFQHISTAMPQDRPGSLAPEEYAAVVAYLLRANGRPAGDLELPADPELLERMRW
jgi:mono/diheme cytochrome c family protein